MTTDLMGWIEGWIDRPSGEEVREARGWLRTEGHEEEGLFSVKRQGLISSCRWGRASDLNGSPFPSLCSLVRLLVACVLVLGFDRSIDQYSIPR